MYCKYCGEKLNDEAEYCKGCGKKLAIPEQLKAFESEQITKSELEPKKDSLKTYAVVESNEEILAEGKKQLGGIVIFLWVLISLMSIFVLISLFVSCESMFVEDFYSGLDLLFYTFIYGGILSLFIFAQLGIKKRKPFAVPLIRIILILGCSSLVGIILVLVIFWKRINNPYAKKYLNYFDGTSFPIARKGK